MAESSPSKSDIEAVFGRLRTVLANKACFDCGAKNPTWSSITYGVFICIDCSAVHRGLGVHLTFVRSTQLDTNWTWVQLRQMQLGGNANALQFFSQHNCVTADTQKKYNSRAAQLYRDKLHNMAISSTRTDPGKSYGHDTDTSNELHFQPHTNDPVPPEEKEVDFFEEHENSVAPEHVVQPPAQEGTKPVTSEESLGAQPSVNLSPDLESNEERKPTIGVRKIQPKKGLGGKKSGLGATKVKTNFADIEREAAAADEARIQATAELQKATTLVAEEEEKKAATLRLAYQDLSLEQKKHEDKLKKTDPKKAEQVERLGMGFGARAGISHSALGDMKVIEQENVFNTQSTLSKLSRVGESDSFFDDYGWSMNRNSNSFANSLSNKSLDLLLGSREETTASVISPAREWANESGYEKPKARSDVTSKSSYSSDSDMAQKKFGSAKAISSDQFFNDREPDYETKANLSRFQGSTSISSSEFFGNGKENVHSSSAQFHPPDLEDVKESVRQGVTKVAGKLSSLANGVMSSIQDRYGY